MLSFQQRVALRIASVSALLALVASPLAWYVSRENAEDGIVAFAIEESNRLLRHHEAFDLHGDHGRAHAEAAARTLSGGLFDIAEI